MLIGAVDIGSNAMRFLVSSANNYGNGWVFQRLEYLRYPIRLGTDVFSGQAISEVKKEKLTQMLSAFKTMFEVFEVEKFEVCATSAMRDANNRLDVVDYVEEKTGIVINVLSGQREADLTDKYIIKYLDNKDYLHIDVGGGSTEVNLISQNKKIASKSFNIGTLRALQKGGIENEKWNDLHNWIETYVNQSVYQPITIGTGGNIKKLHELSGLQAELPVSYDQLIKLKEDLKLMTIEERMQKLKLNQDRADVIVPASEIYLNIMEWANSKTLFSPNTGLIDGIILDIFEKLKK
ncbi:MAG: phosphatase [Cytophagales bacterium]|nr:MAG: phosphatase [Cytophagales bacterium]